MTPEQNEQWKKAILPMAKEVMDGSAMTLHSLFEAKLRHQEWGVPGWADRLRQCCIVEGWKDSEPWVAEFTLRSELYLLGLQLRYHASDHFQFDTYKRVLLRFFHEVLIPFEPGAREDDNGNAYDAFVFVHQLCENVYAPIQETKWLDALKSISADYHQTVAANSGATNNLLNLLRSMLRDWQSALFRPGEYDSRWYGARDAAVSNLVSRLNRQHQWRIEGKADDARKTYIALVAQAYLTALEAECPSPDWMLEAI